MSALYLYSGSDWTQIGQSRVFFTYGWPSQNVLKSDLNKSRICPHSDIRGSHDEGTPLLLLMIISLLQSKHPIVLYLPSARLSVRTSSK